MELFLDTAELDEIVKYRDFIDGVTTNPSIMSKYKLSDHGSLIKEICKVVSGHVSVEVISQKYDDMVKEGRRISKICDNVCVKLPCTSDGLRACKTLSIKGIPTNLTLCFSSIQALLAAKCGATYVSPFLGRLDDNGHDGMLLVEEIVEIFDAQGYETKVLSASVRNLQHVIQSARVGASAITISPQIFGQCLQHHLTTLGLERFSEDFQKSK
ncbi:MAG: fructose-6-phosphate aldolase [Holosporaceae bacterium]|jgi:transaldolase|nr:fructose-6-phosphate aldolase [Holosporaceae bacterium]